MTTLVGLFHSWVVIDFGVPQWFPGALPVLPTQPSNKPKLSPVHQVILKGIFALAVASLLFKTQEYLGRNLCEFLVELLGENLCEGV